MYGKWWIEKLERDAVEDKFEAFRADLINDERVWLEDILRQKFNSNEAQIQRGVLSKLANQGMGGPYPSMTGQFQQRSNSALGNWLSPFGF